MVTEWAAHERRTYQGHILASKLGDSMTNDEVAARLSQHGSRVEIRSDHDVRTALSKLEAEELASSSMFNLAEPAPTAKALFKYIPEKDTVVFEINSSRQGLIVLAVAREGVIARHQSDLTDIQLRSLVLNYTRIVRESVGEADDGETLQQFAEIISKEILEPLKHTLYDKETAVFAPSHPMQLFP
jgi:hypothetical protein